MKRRRLLASVCALGIGGARIGAAQTGTAPGEPDPPKVNDWLVFAYGDRAGQRIAPGDLDVGARQVFAFPLDPAGDVPRGGRLNQIVVVKLDPAWLSESTRARSVDGVVAYSGVCTHAGCDIDIWAEEQRRLQCMCHESQFDPADGATVVGGPALSPLAALPLELVDGHLAVAAAFVGRVGFQQTGLSLNPFGL